MEIVAPPTTASVDRLMSRAAPSPSGVAAGLAPKNLGIIHTPQASGWNAGLVHSPMVFWDHASQRWGMVYTGYSNTNQATAVGKIGLRWSNDLIRWTEDAASPILAAAASGPDTGGVTAPYMWVENGTYYLYYLGFTLVGIERGVKSLCLATASSPTGPWTRQGVKVASGVAPWAAEAVWHPSIVLRNGTYYMFLNGNLAGGAEGGVGYLTADSIAGPWTAYQGASLLTLGTGGGLDYPDGATIADPSVWRAGDYWYMAYQGISNYYQQITDNLAWTTDAEFPLNWRKHPQNPILNPDFGADAAYSGGGRPFILPLEHGHYHFYTAEIGNNRMGIALAVRDVADAGPWQYVAGGGAAAPNAFVSDFFPQFLNSFGNFGSGQGTFGPVRYRRHGDNLQLAGIAAIPASGNDIFTLPHDMRPVLAQSFRVPSGIWGGAAGSIGFTVGSTVGIDRASMTVANSTWVMVNVTVGLL